MSRCTIFLNIYTEEYIYIHIGEVQRYAFTGMHASRPYVYIYIRIKNSYYHIPGMKPRRSPQYRNMYIYLSGTILSYVYVYMHIYTASFYIQGI